jgi:transposase InsO family protein
VSHRSARLTEYGRLLLCLRVCESGWTIAEAAEAAGVSRQTGSKWVGRFRAEGQAGLVDRSTRPQHSPTRLPPFVTSRIQAARLRFRWGPHRLSWMLGLARSTIYAVLLRAGLNRLRRLEVKAPVRRYEWARPGDLLHLDTKKLGRIGQGGGKRFDENLKGQACGLGWNFVHIAVDDHSRLAYAEELADETGLSAAMFTSRALTFFASHGITVRRILSDNAGCYRSREFLGVLATHGIACRKTRPYRPQTNGKAEAFVKILTNEWAYGAPFANTQERFEALAGFLAFYNQERPHGGIGGTRPIERVRQ